MAELHGKINWGPILTTLLNWDDPPRATNPDPHSRHLAMDILHVPNELEFDAFAQCGASPVCCRFQDRSIDLGEGHT